jgi:hypothetical protein
MISEDGLQTGLHWERLVEELLIESFLHVMDEDRGDTLVVVLGPSRTAYHLQLAEKFE